MVYTQISLNIAIAFHDFTEPEIVYVTKKCSDAIKYIHDNQIAHRDMKSGNIVLGINGDCKLS